MKRKRPRGRRHQVSIQTKPCPIRQRVALALFRNGWRFALGITVGKIRYGIGGKWHKVSLGAALGAK